MTLAHEVGGLAHDLGAIVGRGRAPHGKTFFRGGERAVEIGRARMRQVRERLFCCRVDHVLAGAAFAVEPLAVDIEFELGVHGGSPGGFPRRTRACVGALLAQGFSRFSGRVHPSR
jgi:hypothetical protein